MRPLKHALLGTAVLFLVFATCTHAGPVSTFNITNVTITIYSAGFGDNATLYLTGPGTNFAAVGDDNCFTCVVVQGIGGLPGQPAENVLDDVSGEITLENEGNYFSPAGSSPEIGGTFYNPISIFNVESPDLTLDGDFLFPSHQTVGDSFTGCVAATLSPASLSVMASPTGDGADTNDINLALPTHGSFCSTWTLEPLPQYSPETSPTGNAYFYGFGYFTSTPEPGTFVLLMSGLLAFGLVLKRRSLMRILYEQVVERVGPPIQSGCPPLWKHLEPKLEEARRKGRLG